MLILVTSLFIVSGLCMLVLLALSPFYCAIYWIITGGFINLETVMFFPLYVAENIVNYFNKYMKSLTNKYDYYKRNPHYNTKIGRLVDPNNKK